MILKGGGRHGCAMTDKAAIRSCGHAAMRPRKQTHSTHLGVMELHYKNLQSSEANAHINTSDAQHCPKAGAELPTKATPVW